MSSIQFRSRIKPAINYTPKLNDFGVCCSDDGTYSSKVFIECFNEGGHFLPLDPNAIPQETTPCPIVDSELGCCCSCSYVTPSDLSSVPVWDDTTNLNHPYLSSGTRSNVSRCECERKGGKWTAGACPNLTTSNWQNICVKDITENSKQYRVDVRTPRRCFHLGIDSNTGWPAGISCANVCTEYDCSLLNTDAYPSIFGEPNDVCSDGDCASSGFKSIFATKTELYEGFDIGSCYTLEDNDGVLEYECALSPKSLCDGYWVKELDQENPYCTSTHQPTDPVSLNGAYDVQRMSLSSFNALGLSYGDEFQGGIYIGIFKPSPLNARSSDVYGNITFGEPKLGRFTADSVGGTDKQWALIVDETAYSVPFLLEKETDDYFSTSLWDGYYNTYGNNTSFLGIQTALTNTVRYNTRKGFIDYYLPSIYELYFYSAYLYNRGITTRGNLLSSSVFNSKYINAATSKSRIYNSGHVYGQLINSEYDMNFKTALFNKRNKETVYFFRRIVLT